MKGARFGAGSTACAENRAGESKPLSSLIAHQYLVLHGIVQPVAIHFKHPSPCCYFCTKYISNSGICGRACCAVVILLGSDLPWDIAWGNAA